MDGVWSLDRVQTLEMDGMYLMKTKGGSLIVQSNPQSPPTSTPVFKIFCPLQSLAQLPPTHFLPPHPSHTQSFLLLPRLPPHSPNPPGKPPHLLLLQQPLHGIILPRKLLMPGKAMHKPMARATQPRHVLQLVLPVPPALDRLVVDHPRDQVVVRQVDPVPPADLAGVDLAPSGGGRRRRCRRGADVRGEHGREELGHGKPRERGQPGGDAVGCQRVGDAWVKGLQQGRGALGRERERGVEVLEVGVGRPEVVGKGLQIWGKGEEGGGGDVGGEVGEVGGGEVGFAVCGAGGGGCIGGRR
ncbi:hypothetical protein VTI74DRAFT_8760 [Chaetomium olivicolor]